MAKEAVYSWRLAAERKAQLEEVARKRKRPFADLLDEAVAEWLKRALAEADDQEASIRAKAEQCIGSIAGGDPDRASEVREHMQETPRETRRIAYERSRTDRHRRAARPRR